MTQSTILVVDDEELNRVMLEGLLEEHYDVTSVENGKACLVSVEETKPDAIILDVDMPDIDGLECCRRLRAQYNSLELPILFVSGMTSDEDRLEGYKAGGDDYITKPYNEDELLQKIKAILQISKAAKASQESSAQLQKMAKEAMSNASEIGNILAFVKNSFNYDNFNELSKELFKNLKLFNLQASVLFVEQEKVVYHFDDGFQRPLEITALQKVHAIDKRIIDFGTKTIFNSSNASLLVRNMPLDNDELNGRLKDNFIILIEAVNSRVKGVNLESNQQGKHKVLSSMIDSTKKNIKQIEDEQIQQQEAISNIISDIGGKVEEIFLHLGLEETQEKAIIDVISEAENSSNALFENKLDLETRFELIIHALETIK